MNYHARIYMSKNPTIPNNYKYGPFILSTGPPCLPPSASLPPRRVKMSDAAPPRVDNRALARALCARLGAHPGYAPHECLFDGAWHGSAAGNVEHMAVAHGFRVPHAALLRDARGLLVYLGQKVGVAHACLACGRAFECARDVQRHMEELGHARLGGGAAGMRAEYARFYELGTAAAAAEAEEEEGAAAEMGARHREGRQTHAVRAAGKMRGGRGVGRLGGTAGLVKMISKRRDGGAEGRKAAAAAKKVAAVASSPMARRAALVMVGGPGVAVVQGAPLAVAVGQRVAERARGAAAGQAGEEERGGGMGEVVREVYRRLGCEAADGEVARRGGEGETAEMAVGGEVVVGEAWVFQTGLELFNAGRARARGAA